MIDQQAEHSNVDVVWDVDAPVPAARPLSDFCMERVGDDVVLYDAVNVQYHTLNLFAYDVWRMCEQNRSVVNIVNALSRDRAEVHAEGVLLAISELGEAGLLAQPGSRLDPRLQRRRVL